MENNNPIKEIEGIYGRNLIRIVSNVTSCKHQFLNWLHDNENIKDTNEYKAVILLCSFYYFELDEYNKLDGNIYDTHPFKSEMNRMDYLFNQTIELLKYFTKDVINNLSFNNELKDKLLFIKSNEHSFLISNNANGKYNFKELMIRKYVNYYIDKNNSKYNSKILEAIKESKIIKYTDCMYFMDQIYREYNRTLYDLDEFKDPEKEYDMYDGLCTTANGIQYKYNLDMFFFKLIEWINKNNISELEQFKNYMIYYLENNKSKYPEYNDYLLLIKIFEKTKNINEDNIKDVLDKKIKQDVNSKQEQLIKTIKEEYKLDIEKLEKINTEWYEYIIQGQFFYELVKNTDFMNDYCGAVLYWCKCVESMMYEKIFEKLNPVTFYKDVKDGVHTLGTIPYICGFGKPKRSIDDKDKSRLISENIKWKQKIGREYDFDKFLNDVHELNERFRRACAHRDTIDYGNVEECRKLIFITSQMISKLIKL